MLVIINLVRECTFLMLEVGNWDMPCGPPYEKVTLLCP